jgi:tRNA nucleotidyltransferase (CCA-adding enzyme)
MNTYQNLIQKIPKEVSRVTSKLEEAGFEAYLVGGCVRDLIMDRAPKDWDLTTNANPEQIIALFEKTVYENKFGTVAVIQEDVSQETFRQIEVTPYRIEGQYTDFRHPDEVKFSDKIEDDLERRDFTVNALALNSKGQIVDLFDGIKDIKDKTLRTVGEADDRFTEDALRMLRAIRFVVELNFSLSNDTTESIVKNAHLVKEIANERIRDEFVKIIMSPNPSAGISMLQKFGLLKYIVPELEEGLGCEQAGEHIYDVWDHLLHALAHAGEKGWPLEVRLAALFHDIGKPRTRRGISQGQKTAGEIQRNSPSGRFRPQGGGKQENFSVSSPVKSSKKKYTFYGHEVVGARMAQKIMERLKFPKKEMELVEKLIRTHMFFSDTEQITLSAVRRIIAKVGKENIWLLMNVRECDRVGMKKKEAPYRLRKYFAMIEEALRDPISVGALKINGEYMMKELGIKAGPRMGWILNAMLEEVLDDPTKNTVEHLSDLTKSLNMLGDAELKVLGERGKEKKEELEGEEVEKLHTKHGVRKN